MFAKFKTIRCKLLNVIKNPYVNLKEKYYAQKKMNNIPRDASLSRQRKRCWKTGRSRGVYRMFGLSRHMLRNYTTAGDIPGLRKSSW